MKKLAIFFPGAGYGMDCPLLYYADFLYETNGFERIHLDYQNILLNMELSLEDKQKQLRSYIWEQLEPVDFSSYDEIVFISKSIGCEEAGRIVDFCKLFGSLNVDPVQIFLTPVAEALPYCGKNCRVVIGTHDKAYSLFHEHCNAHQIPLLAIAGGDHSLEISGKPFESIEALKQVLEFIHV